MICCQSAMKAVFTLFISQYLSLSAVTLFRVMFVIYLFMCTIVYPGYVSFVCFLQIYSRCCHFLVTAGKCSEIKLHPFLRVRWIHVSCYYWWLFPSFLWSLQSETEFFHTTQTVWQVHKSLFGLLLLLLNFKSKACVHFQWVSRWVVRVQKSCNKL